MSKKYLLGVDGGTEGLRAGIFDTSGTPLAYASTTYTTQFTAELGRAGPQRLVGCSRHVSQESSSDVFSKVK